MRVVKDQVLLSVDGYELHRLKYNLDMHFLYISKDGKRVSIPKEFTFINTDEDFCDVKEVFRDIMEVYPMSLRHRHLVMYKGELIIAFERRLAHDIIGFESAAEACGATYHKIDDHDEEIDYHPNDPEYITTLVQSHEKHQANPILLNQ